MIASKNRRNLYIRKPKGKEEENPSRPSFDLLLFPPLKSPPLNSPFHTIPYPLNPPFLKGQGGFRGRGM